MRWESDSLGGDMKYVHLIVTGCLAAASCTAEHESKENVLDSTDLGNERITQETAKRLSLEYLQKRAALDASTEGELQSVRSVFIDERGEAHTRVSQTYQGVPVFGAQVIVHLKPDGSFNSITERTLKDIGVDIRPTLTEPAAIEVAVNSVGGWPNISGSPQVDLQILKNEGPAQLTWRVQLNSMNNGDPQMPVVFVDAHKTDVISTYDNLQRVKEREIYNLNNTSTLPGTLVRSEGQPDTGDYEVDTNYAVLGKTYDCYHDLFGRDSYDNNGAKLVSSVHHINKDYAAWNGTQFVFGDSSGTPSQGFANSIDITGHEFTHAVIQATSDLTDWKESGGINESLGDIFGNVCEWYRDNNGDTNAPASENNWILGEGTTQNWLRYLSDPKKSDELDYYDQDTKFVDGSFSLGISNLAFYLLAQGGKHPRGKSKIEVTGIGMYAAARIFYRANAVYLLPNSTFSDFGQATLKAAADLFGERSPQAFQTINAWRAVGVTPTAVPRTYRVVDYRQRLYARDHTELHFQYPSNGALAMKFVASNDDNVGMYVKFGSPPVLPNDFDCRGASPDGRPTCEFSWAQQGTYYVTLFAWGAFSEVELTVYATGAMTGEICGDGIDNDGDRQIDCGDFDCRDEPCALPVEAMCDDGIDNDFDGKTDCVDADCSQSPVCGPATETTCNDGVDNDADSKTDCADSDCSESAACGSPVETNCNDVLDNDTDGKTDCDDPDCFTAQGCGLVEVVCKNGFDDDGDGETDCADPDCFQSPVCGPPIETICNDGIDNDADGKTDCSDINCALAPGCDFATEIICNDGVDNDADGKTDCADPDCSSAPMCGLNWVEFSSHDFELGWLNYREGGEDATLINNPNHASSGNFSVRIRDDNGVASSFHTLVSMNLTAYNQMKIDYAFYAEGMEPGENFVVEALDGIVWKPVSDKVSGTGFANNVHLKDSVTVDLNSLANKAAVDIRFRCDASDDSDEVFIDDITVSVK